MNREDGTGVGRRDLLGLGALAAVAGLSTGAQALPAMGVLGAAAKGAGIPTPTPVVKTHSGPVQGLVTEGVHSFLGIRYGAPPVGPLRWMPPQPPKPWTGVYDASDYGAPAMQMAGGSSVDAANDFAFQMHRVFTTPSELKVMNEDCLYLNVWTPAIDGRKRPVMVWLHGGGFVWGSGGQPAYQGGGLAKSGDVVAVSVNHRLNVFGYLHLGDTMGSD